MRSKNFSHELIRSHSQWNSTSKLASSRHELRASRPELTFLNTHYRLDSCSSPSRLHSQYSLIFRQFSNDVATPVFNFLVTFLQQVPQHLDIFGLDFFLQCCIKNNGCLAVDITCLLTNQQSYVSDLQFNCSVMMEVFRWSCNGYVGIHYNIRVRFKPTYWRRSYATIACQLD